MNFQDQDNNNNIENKNAIDQKDDTFINNNSSILIEEPSSSDKKVDNHKIDTNLFIELSKGTDYRENEAREIVNNFINFDPNNFKADSSKLTKFVSYLKDCAHCKLNIMYHKANSKEYDVAKKQADRLSYLEDKLQKATGKKDYAIREKVANFLKKFGLLIISPFRGIQKMKEAGRDLKSPLETKRQVDFESAFSDLRKELDQIRGIQKMKEAGRNFKSPLETKNQADFESAFSDLRKELDQIEKGKNKSDKSI